MYTTEIFDLIIAAYRSRMNDLKYNFGGEDICICRKFLDNEHLFNCETLNKGRQRSTEYNIKYLIEASKNKNTEFRY